jgi:hypothetical protein
MYNIFKKSYLHWWSSCICNLVLLFLRERKGVVAAKDGIVKNSYLQIRSYPPFPFFYFTSSLPHQNSREIYRDTDHADKSQRHGRSLSALFIYWPKAHEDRKKYA